MGVNQSSGMGWMEMLEMAADYRKTKAEREKRMASQYNSVLDILNKLQSNDRVIDIRLSDHREGLFIIRVMCDGQVQGLTPLISRDVVSNMEMDTVDDNVVYNISFEDGIMEISHHGYEKSRGL